MIVNKTLVGARAYISTVLLSLFLAACGGGGADGSTVAPGPVPEPSPAPTPTDPVETNTVDAVFVKGMVDGANCELFEVNSTGVKGSSITTAASANGNVSFGSNIQYIGVALIECTGGTYIDEATGSSLNAPLTRAVINIIADATFTVSPLTEIATALAELEGDLETALSRHNTDVATAFGLTAAITDVIPVDLQTSPANDTDAGQYATVLALISQLDANLEGDVSTIVDTLVTDLTDGNLSSDFLSDFSEAILDLATSSVVTNIREDTINSIVILANIPTSDIQAPTGYTVAIDQDAINAENQAELSFTVSGAEVGASYSYNIRSGSGSISGSGSVTASTFSVSNINVSALPDGTLTLNFLLTDDAGNTGVNAVSSVMKTVSDITAPVGYTVAINQTSIDSTNQTSFGFNVQNAEIGTQYTYQITSGSEVILESGTVVSNMFNISDIDVSALPDGTLTLSFSLTDDAGNTGVSTTDSVIKTTSASTVSISGSLTFDLVPHLQVGNGLDYDNIIRSPIRGAVGSQFIGCCTGYNCQQ